MTSTDYIRLAAVGAAAVVLITLLLLVRTVFVIHQTHSHSHSDPPRKDGQSTATLAIFLGSGGHTAEMVRLVSSLNWTRYSHRIYIISSGDTLSESKALSLEKEIGSGSFKIHHIPRARRVLQSYLTSPFTTLYSFAFCLWLITISPLFSPSPSPTPSRSFASLILLNGPGSCVPIVLSAFLSRILFLPSPPKLIYIESLARTKKLSLSGRIVRFFVDRFFVQWEGLRDILRDGKGEGRWGVRLRLKAEVEWRGWLV